MRKLALIVTALVLCVASPVSAAAKVYPWRDHAAPFDFLFGNHIDTHQQSLILDGGNLQGFFYIRFTGELEDGYPVAEHANCEMMPDECAVGWILAGKPVTATLKEHSDGEHPTWCVDAADLPDAPGFTHFHWLGDPAEGSGLEIGQAYDGYLLQLTARDTFFFEHHGGFLITPGIDDESHANVVTDCS